MPTSYSTKQEGIDYYFLIVRHIDRMSEGLKEGLDVGKINTKTLVGYYQQVIHLESLLTPFLNKKYYEQKAKWSKKIPSYEQTWSSELKDQVEYFKSISNILQLLIIWAYNNGVLKIKRIAQYKMDEDIL